MIFSDMFVQILFVFFIATSTSFFNKKMPCIPHHFYMKKESVTTFQKLSFSYLPKTPNQQTYYDNLNNKNISIVISVGPAGTGKTLLACTTAIHMLQKKQIDKIIITRPVVPVEEEIGFLPGSLVKKMDPWTRPIFDIFCEYYSNSEIAQMINNNIIEISPLGFMRGRTFKNAFIIADEMQNTSPNQMFMLLTRIGENSRMVLTGDLVQSDRLVNNGLKDFIEKYKRNTNYTSSIKLVELNNTDVERSKIVENIIKIYETKITPTLVTKPRTPRARPKSNKTKLENTSSTKTPNVQQPLVSFVNNSNNNATNLPKLVENINNKISDRINEIKNTTNTKMKQSESDAAMIPLYQYRNYSL